MQHKQHQRLIHLPHGRRQRGISLIESLVALIVAALGILGIIGMQMRTLADSQNSVRRAQAVRLIDDLSERMRANPNALAVLDDYASGWTDDMPPTDGSDPGCGTGGASAPLAGTDLCEWKAAVARTLPSGQAAIFTAPAEEDAGANRRQLGVMIAWRENERSDDASFKNPINAAAGGGSVTCPSNHTCHLQYLPVAARCAPYKPVGGTVFQHYCAGK